MNHVLLRLAAREQNDLRSLRDGDDLADDVQTGETGHQHIEQYEIGLKGLSLRDSILGVAGLTDNFEACLIQGRGQPGPEEGHIVNN